MTFARKPYERPARQPLQLGGEPRAGLRMADGRARLTVQVPKDPPLRSEPYRRYVASLPCAHCGRAGPSQCAHADEGKGLSMKASDRTCFPLCADGPGRQGCHSMVGASGAFSREQRRVLEDVYGSATRLQAVAEGNYPEGWL